MNPMDLIMGLLTFLGQVPYVGPILATIVSLALPVTAVVTALVACWHAVVMVFSALAMVPGLGSLQALADKLKHSEELFGGFVSKYVLMFLNRLSMLPLPKKQ